MKKAMKKITVASTVLAAAGAAGCQTTDSAQPLQRQAVRLDDSTILTVQVEGVQPGSAPAASVFRRSNESEPIHRILEDGSGKALFTYDLQLSRSEPDGAYTFLLKPAGQGPTFASSRKVTMKSSDDAVRVDLMEQPDTGRKISDVYRVQKSATHAMSLHAHLMALHERLYRWVHGE